MAFSVGKTPSLTLNENIFETFSSFLFFTFVSSSLYSICPSAVATLRPVSATQPPSSPSPSSSPHLSPLSVSSTSKIESPLLSLVSALCSSPPPRHHCALPCHHRDQLSSIAPAPHVCLSISHSLSFSLLVSLTFSFCLCVCK